MDKLTKLPRCIIITGRPGSGKTTLAGELSRRLYLPKLSRDEVKEGYVNTFKVKHDQLPDDTNGVVNEVYFDAVRRLLKGSVSLVIEAAFQHQLWSKFVPGILEVAQIGFIICELDAETSARRHLERGLNDPQREFFHGDRRVSLYRETGQFSPGEPYAAPDFPVPTMKVSTLDGYVPEMDALVRFVQDLPDRSR